MKGKDISIYAVWVPVLAADARFTVGRATKHLPDSRVLHYWDQDAALVRDFVPVLGIERGKAWDVYLLYGGDAVWKEIPPKPVYWQEQLGISDETQLDPDKMTAEIEKLLQSQTK